MERTNADLELFQNPDNKEIIIDTLVVWSSKNSDIKYRQGMNEIAALIFLVLYEEALENPYPNAADKELIGSYLFL